MKKTLYTLLPFLGLLLLLSRPVSAAVIDSQTVDTGYHQASNQGTVYRFTGISGSLKYISLKLSSTYAGQTTTLSLYRCDGDTVYCGSGTTLLSTFYAPGGTGTSTVLALTSTKTEYLFTSPSTISLSATTTYMIQPYRTTYGQDFRVYGSASDVKPSNRAMNNYNTFAGDLDDDYYVFYDSNGQSYPPTVTTTTLNPAAGTFNVVGTWMASTTACASQYLDVWQNTGLESHRELSLHGVFPITTAPIYATTSGAFNFTFDIIDSGVSVGATSTTYSLTPNQQFNAQLYQSTCGYDPFTGSGVAPALLTSTTTTTVATSSTIVAGGINNNPFTGANFGNNSLPTSTDMLSFVNVPNLLATKVPFAYVFQISSVIYNAVNGSTSASAIPSGSFSVKFPVKFGISGVATATTTIKIDMFSTSTIGYFLTPSYVGLLRGLMVAVTYFLTAWYLFHEARNRKLL
ncbi:MAG: hypothetical protein NT077_00435 [Candidatus Taylorbacteria bacterium]|nr:hypothetical protein [Candidatus Taylorbacteria bacterium]